MSNNYTRGTAIAVEYAWRTRAGIYLCAHFHDSDIPAYSVSFSPSFCSLHPMVNAKSACNQTIAGADYSMAWREDPDVNEFLRNVVLCCDAALHAASPKLCSGCTLNIITMAFFRIYCKWVQNIGMFSCPTPSQPSLKNKYPPDMWHACVWSITNGSVASISKDDGMDFRTQRKHKKTKKILLLWY